MIEGIWASASGFPNPRPMRTPFHGIALAPTCGRRGECLSEHDLTLGPQDRGGIE